MTHGRCQLTCLLPASALLGVPRPPPGLPVFHIPSFVPAFGRQDFYPVTPLVERSHPVLFGDPIRALPSLRKDPCGRSQSHPHVLKSFILPVSAGKSPDLCVCVCVCPLGPFCLGHTSVPRYPTPTQPGNPSRLCRLRPGCCRSSANICQCQESRFGERQMRRQRTAAPEGTWDHFPRFLHQIWSTKPLTRQGEGCLLAAD